MSLWTCPCDHCRIWRAATRASLGSVAAARHGIDEIEYAKRLLEIPELAALLMDMKRAFYDEQPEDIDALVSAVKGALGHASKGSSENPE